MTQNEFNFLQEACVDKINSMLFALVTKSNESNVAKTPKKQNTTKKETK